MPQYRIIVDLSDYQSPAGRQHRGTYVPGCHRQNGYTDAARQLHHHQQAPNPGTVRSLLVRVVQTPLRHPWHERPFIHRRSVSLGCIRMYNEDVTELASLVPIHTRVTIRN